jgi:hypothetical protein
MRGETCIEIVDLKIDKDDIVVGDVTILSICCKNEEVL